ncbi:MAG: hypothetical protein RLY71_1982 [Pseudomonadota bacterium]|jgi:hypothetical protein
MNQETNHLEAARAAFADARALLAKNAAEQTRVEAVGEPSRQVVADAQQRRQQRAALMARIIKEGDSSAAAADLAAADKAIRASLADEQRAHDMLEAQAAVLAELQHEGEELARHVEATRRTLLVAQHAVAEREIMDEARPEFMAAVEALSAAYGKLAGLGAAHVENADRLNKSFGAGVLAVGSRFPWAEFDVYVTGFNLNWRGVLNRVHIDAAEHIAGAKADALGRWASEEH